MVTTDIIIPDRVRRGVVLILSLTVLVAISATYFGAKRLFEAQAVSVAAGQHGLYLRSLNEAINKHQHLPFVIGQNPRIADQLARGLADTVSRMLAGFATASQLEAIYIMNMDGAVVAASNYQQPNSFLDQNYGFRPYFQNAANGMRADYFAIGATTGRPGYFVAEPLRSNTGDIIGVIAIKLDISELQASWEDRGEEVLAINADGIVVMSSNPDWLYQTVADMQSNKRDAISDSRQFGTKDITRLEWVSQPNGQVSLEGQTYLVASGKTDIVDWTVHYLTRNAAVQRQTLVATAILGAFITGLIAFSVFLRSRRIKAALDISQIQRQALEDSNARLVTAQEELARSSKLAALGQLSASVTHELGQPISAFKNHLFAAEIGNEITSSETLFNLRRLAERMENITKQLRFFARQGGDERRDIDIISVVNEATKLVRHDLEARNVELNFQKPLEPCLVLGNQLQLEQAVVNLVRNGFHALQDQKDPQISIECTKRAGEYTVRVIDNGPGLQGQSIETLQEPFYSTRSSGDGMGLGLAITTEIVHAHGGTITAEDRPNGGAIFAISLPAAEGSA